MSEISSKIRNYPNSFAKPMEFCKHLACYSIRGVDQSEYISPPRKPTLFKYGGRSGIPLYYSSEEKKVYVDHTDKHTAVIGPTASKKSRLIAMPAIRLLGAAGESMIISDPKAEIYQRTSTYLNKKGYEIKVLNLRDPQYGSAWNPLSVPYTFYKSGNIDRAYEFANDIAVNMTNLDKSEKEVFWDNSAGSFFFGLILLLFRFCDTFGEPIQSVNIENVLKLRNIICSGTGKNPANNPLWRFAREDPFITSSLIGTIETANETRAGILSVFDQKMRAFSIQPSLLNMLSYNDINYALLTEKPTAIFLVLPDEKTGYHGLVSLFVKQSYEFLIHQAQNVFNKRNESGIRVNYILDEFSSLPTISDFSAMITAARSRNIRFNLFLQSKHQLRLRYGEDCDTILSNCENWIFLTSRELEFLKEVSELCGECGGGQKKPLLSIPELQRFCKESGEALLLSGRNKPMITQLVDIDFFDGGKPHAVTFSNPTIREPSEIDFITPIRRWINKRFSNKASSSDANIETNMTAFENRSLQPHFINNKNIEESLAEVPTISTQAEEREEKTEEDA